MKEITNIDAITEHEGEKWIEASSAGLKPGEWPEEIMLDHRVYYRKNAEQYDGDLMSFSYYSPVTGWTLVIVND